MRRIEVPLPWAGVSARVGMFGLPGSESRLPPPMRRVHQSRCARALAIDLLAAQGASVQEIPKGPVGQPLWPQGFVGSLAHTEHYAAAVIARSVSCAALGIDIEPALPLPDETAELILGDDERAWVAAQTQDPAAGRLIFCAKECVHKAIHPLTGVWLDFLDVRIDCDLGAASFRVVPLSPAARNAFAGCAASGKIALIEAHLVTVLMLTRP